MKIVENHSEVINYQFLRRNLLKSFLFYLFGVGSFGIVFIIFYWYPDLYQILYSTCEDYAQSTHVVFRTVNKSFICRFQKTDQMIQPRGEKKSFRYVVYCYNKYMYNIGNDSFEEISKVFSHRVGKLTVFDGFSPLDEEEISTLASFYGDNIIRIDMPNPIVLLVKSFIVPINIIELVIASIDFYYRKYVFFGLLTIYIVNQTILLMVAEIQKVNKINKLTEQTNNVTVLRTIGGRAQKVLIDSKKLQIGDIIYLQANSHLTCDVLIIEGSCLINEAVLTGESVPVTKNSVKGGTRPNTNNYVYSGSECMLLRTEEVKGVVTCTAWSTYKGSLVSMLMNPSYMEFKFNRDFFQINLILITTFMIFFSSLILNDVINRRFSLRNTLLRFSEMIICAIQPSVLFVYYVITYLTVKRLLEKDVSCLLFGKIPECGRVKKICFDKTGTLTSDQLKINGYSIFSDKKLQEPYVETKFLEIFDNYRYFVEVMACCHSLNVYKGNVVGDPIEVEMFEKAAFSFEFGNQSKDMNESEKDIAYGINPTIEYKRQFKLDKSFRYRVRRTLEFTSERKRMSVIVKLDKDSKADFRILCKGAPETIRWLCKDMTIPSNFERKLKLYSEQGFRVFAFAYKDLNKSESLGKEQELEKNMNFLGFMLVHNPIKPETKGIIEKLTNNGISSCMITGDNVFTAINIGLVSTIIPESSVLWVGETKHSDIEWNYFESKTPVDPEQIYANNNTDAINSSNYSVGSLLNESMIFKNDDMKLKGYEEIVRILENINTVKQNVKIAMDGDAFEILVKNYYYDKELIHKILQNTLIYGRTKPNQKEHIVLKLKEMYSPSYYTVGFVGDGSNDCKALNAANLGLSIGNSESSITASFSTQTNNISPVLDIIVLGKYTLENYIQFYKIGIFGNLTSLLIIFLLGLINLNFSNWQYAFNNLPWLPSFLLMCLTKPSEMNRLYPLPGLLNEPTLESMRNVTGMGMGLIIIFLMIIVDSSNYKPIESIYYRGDDIDFNYLYSPQVMFAYIYQLLITVCVQIAYNRGYPFKKSIFTNFWFMGYTTFVVIVLLSFIYNRFYDQVADFKVFAETLNIATITVDEESDFMHYLLASCFMLFVTEKLIQRKYLRYDMREAAKDDVEEDILKVHLID